MAIHNALIAVDFDGTVVTHAYPEIGDDAGAVAVLKELTDNGCRLILYTMRSGALLDKAVKWFRDPNGMEAYTTKNSAAVPPHSKKRRRRWCFWSCCRLPAGFFIRRL